MIRQFKNNVSELGTVFGQLFIPMLQRVMPIINGVTIALKGLFTNIAGFAGIELDLGSFGQGYSDLEEDLSGVGDAYEDVTNKTKEWKNELYGFDEIEKQSDITAPSLTTEGQDTIDLTDSIQKALADYDKVWNEAFSKMENNALNISKNISKALQPLEDIFADLFSGDFAGAGENTGLLAMNILNYFTDAIESVEWDELGENVADYINGVFKSIDGRDIAKGINAFADMFWDTFSNLLKNVDYGEIIKTIGEVLLNLDWVTIGKLFLAKKGISLGKDLFSGLLGGFKGSFSNTSVFFSGGLGAKATNIGTILGQYIMQGVKSPLMAIPAAVGYILNSTSNYYEDLAEDYADFGSISDEVQGKLDNLKSKIDEINGTSLDINTDFGASDDEIESIEILAGKYFDLKEKVNLTASEQNLLNGYRDALVKSNPAFEKILSDNNLRYDEQKKAIQDITTELKTKARMESASALITEAGKNVFDAENLVSEIGAEFEAQKQVVLDLDNEIKAGQAEIEKLIKKLKTSYDPADERKLHELVKKYNTAIFSQEMETKYDTDLSPIEGIGSVVEAYRDEIQERDALNDKYIEAKKLLDDVNWELDYYVGVAEGVIDADMTMYDYKQKMNEEQKKLAQTSDEAAKAQEDMSSRSETANKNALNTLSNNVSETSGKMNTALQVFDKATGGVIKAVNQTKTEMDKLLKPKVGVELYNQWFNLAYKLGEKYNEGWKAIKTVIVTTLDGIYNYTPVSTRQELSPSLAMLVNTNGSKLNQPQSTYSAYDYFLAQSRQQQTQQQPQGMLFNITIGGKEVTDYVITDVNNRTMQTGRNPFGF